MTISKRGITMRPGPRRSFTLVELIVAGVITAFVLASIATSLSNLARARHSSRQRLAAFLRADAALELIRRDVASIIRHDDLFFTRFQLVDGAMDTEAGRVNRDELLVFSNRLRQSRSIEFNGEGTQYEVQYRIAENDDAPVLWQRRDSFPDEYPRGGGLATPIVDSIIALNVEAYDGYQWRSDWDSDFDGMPNAVRITVTAAGEAQEDEVYDAPLATLRTVVAIDRILLPRENLMALYETEHPPDDESAEDPNALPTGIDDGLSIDPSTGMPRGMRIGPNGEVIMEGGDFQILDPNSMPNGGRPIDPREDRRGRGEDVRTSNPGGSGTSTSSSGGGGRGGGGPPR
jgi:type II secretory pathway component PulJ